MIHVRKYNSAPDKFAVVGTSVIFLHTVPVVEDIISKRVKLKLFSFLLKVGRESMEIFFLKH